MYKTNNIFLRSKSQCWKVDWRLRCKRSNLILFYHFLFGSFVCCVWHVTRLRVPSICGWMCSLVYVYNRNKRWHNVLHPIVWRGDLSYGYGASKWFCSNFEWESIGALVNIVKSYIKSTFTKIISPNKERDSQSSRIYTRGNKLLLTQRSQCFQFCNWTWCFRRRSSCRLWQ